ncbi:MAG: VTC domain-containing protein [Flavobacteriales bacterium]|jgi:hypothetical protein|nr:VTC domain-containing protein [Flavobacteriales bacterium]
MSLPAVLQRFAPIKLAEMDAVQLLVRMDTKYVFGAHRLTELLEELLPEYRLLEVNGVRGIDYQTRYFDTLALKHYFDHHNGRPLRSKVRVRRYGGSGLCVLEVKRKTGRGGTDKRRTPLPTFPNDFLRNTKHSSHHTLAAPNNWPPCWTMLSTGLRWYTACVWNASPSTWTLRFRTWAPPTK